MSFKTNNSVTIGPMENIKEQKTDIRYVFLLFIAAFIWGSAFVAQSKGMEFVGPFTFAGVRYTIGGIVLIPVILIKDKFLSKPELSNTRSKEDKEKDLKRLLKASIICGVCLTVASNLQQVGMQYTTVGKSGFLTALYIIIVPIIGVFMKNRPGVNVWIAACMSVIGLYLLCMKESFSLNKGDLLELLCAFGFSLHIIVIDKYSPNVDGVKLSSLQFFVAGFISTFIAVIFEHPNVDQIIDAALPILYAGLFSSGVAYTLQVISQKKVAPTPASLVMSLESVVSAVSGWIILKEALGVREIWGCIIMFAGTVLAQIPARYFKLKRDAAGSKS